MAASLFSRAFCSSMRVFSLGAPPVHQRKLVSCESVRQNPGPSREPTRVDFVSVLEPQAQFEPAPQEACAQSLALLRVEIVVRELQVVLGHDLGAEDAEENLLPERARRVSDVQSPEEGRSRSSRTRARPIQPSRERSCHESEGRGTRRQRDGCRGSLRETISLI